MSLSRTQLLPVGDDVDTRTLLIDDRGLDGHLVHLVQVVLAIRCW